MWALSVFVFLVIAQVGVSLDTDSSSSSSPIVTLSYGSFQGKVAGTTAQWLGMPFAAPPCVTIYFLSCNFTTHHSHSTGERRFGFPEPPIPFTGVHNATVYGPSCHQQAVIPPPGFPLQLSGPPGVMSEDCMTNEFVDLHVRAHELNRSFHQCCTTCKYLQQETAPGPLRK